MGIKTFCDWGCLQELCFNQGGMVDIRDELELDFHELSRAELEIFRAEPSRAGCIYETS